MLTLYHYVAHNGRGQNEIACVCKTSILRQIPLSKVYVVGAIVVGMGDDQQGQATEQGGVWLIRHRNESADN